MNTKRVYIGSAVSIEKRWRCHVSELNNNKHRNGRLQNAWNKYGDEKFTFSVVAICPKEYLIKMEQFFIDKTNPYYNINRFAGSALGNKMSDKTRQALAKSQIGRVKTKEEIEKRLLKICKRVYQYDLAGWFLREYQSGVAASAATGILHQQIMSCANERIVTVNSYNSRQRTAGGFQWRLYKVEKINSIKVNHQRAVVVYRNGIEVGKYASLAVAARELKIGSSNLASHLKGSKSFLSVKGYTAKELSVSQIQVGS